MIDYNMCLYSLNVNGLGDATKRTAVLSRLGKKNKGIFLLQETHSTEHTELTWRNIWGNNFFSHMDLPTAKEWQS